MLDKIKRFFRFNAIYLGDPPWDTGVSPPELLNFLESAPPGRALDLGSGPGTNLLTMANGGWQVVGVDFALISVLKAKWKLHQAGHKVKVLWGDVTQPMDFGDTFDLVLDMGCFHGLTENGKDSYRKNINKWLKRGGTYLLYAHRRTTPDASYGITEYDIEEFQKFLRLVWRKDSGENRPDGGGGRSATWVRFDR